MKKESTNAPPNTTCITPRITSTAFIDYLSISFTGISDAQFISDLASATSLKFISKQVDQNILNTYRASTGSQLTNSGTLLLYVKSRDNSLLIMPGKDCANIQDWSALHQFVLSLNTVSITRIDIAMDFQHISINEIKTAYKDGQFNHKKNRPKLSTEGDIEEDAGSARTIAFGHRKSQKYLRCYEKGRMSDAFPDALIRIELELKKINNYLIPLDAITKPLQYYCGAYPFLSQFSHGYLRTLDIRKKETEVNINQRTEALKNSYGTQVNLLMAINEENSQEVISLIRREGYPKGVSLEDIDQLKKVSEPKSKDNHITNHDELFAKIVALLKYETSRRNTTPPKVLRLKDAPSYLGVDKNKFNDSIRPHLKEVKVGIRSVGYDRLDLDKWVEDHKSCTECSKSSILGEATWDNQKLEPAASIQKLMAVKQSTKLTKENDSTNDLVRLVKKKRKRACTEKSTQKTKQSSVQKALDSCSRIVRKGT